MIFLYSLAVLLLGVAHFLVKRRVASLEKKYQRVAQEADVLVRQVPRDQSSNRFDPFLAAKRQFVLGQLIQKRDRIEGRYTAWQASAERLGKFVQRVRGWKGRKLPYTFGALDVAFVLALVDYLGFGQHVNVRNLVQVVASLFTG
jgi:hypothetical protein